MTLTARHASPVSGLAGLATRFAAVVAALAGLVVCSAAAHAETPAQFMQRATGALMAAQRSGSQAAFMATIRQYGDVPGIGSGALGTYNTQLPKADRPLYYNGMVNFIARYAVKESPKYFVTKAVVLGQGEEDARGAQVDTRVELRSGETYEVRWLLVRSGASYKIRDAQVLGFWMTPFLATLFQNYIAENGGSSKALIMALNR